MNKDDWIEWKNHPLTRVVIDGLQDTIMQSREDLEALSLSDGTSDEIVRKMARKAGYIDGLKEIERVMEDFNEAVSDGRESHSETVQDGAGY